MPRAVAADLKINQLLHFVLAPSQMQTAVTADLKSNQLLHFVLAPSQMQIAVTADLKSNQLPVYGRHTDSARHQQA